MNLFDLAAKISLDSKDYDRSLQNASTAAEKWATRFTMAAKAVGSAMAGLSKGVIKLSKMAVDSYSEFEQLEGGVETLFGAGGKSFEEWSKSFEQSSDGMQDYIDVARKVINGDFGVGADRKDLLSQAGYDPATVQQMVNNLINGVDVASNISADTISANMQSAEEKYEDLMKAQEFVKNSASGAFKTVGVSQNEYMQNVTSFAASLKQSTDSSYEAAQVANMAMIDMADNANKMGTPLENIQVAYQGFAKQNYTMLDNLKLGYGGTKTEMERLLKDAEKFSGVKYDINNLKDVYEAIHVIQEETGIAGTTAEEAATTIQGSSKMMKAAWTNVLTNMVRGGESFTESINDLVYSAKTFIKNVAPAFKGALEGVGVLISGLVPEVLAILPDLVNDLLPGFVDVVKSIIDSILDTLPKLVGPLKNVASIIQDALIDLIPSLVAFFVDGIPMLVSAGIQLLEGLVSGLADNVDTIIPQLTQGVIDLVDQLISIIQSDGVNLANAGLTLMTGLANALVTAVPDVLTQLTQLIQDLTASLTNAADSDDSNFITTATTILSNLVDGLMTSLPSLIPQLTEAVTAFITKFAELAAENTTSLANAAIGILNSLVTSLGEEGTIQQVMADITTAVMAIIGAIIDVITNLDIATFASACASILSQIADGLVSAITIITEKLPELITGIVAWLTNPENLTGLLGAALTLFGELVADVPAILVALGEGLAGIVTGIVNYFKEHGGEILDGFKEGFTQIGTKMTEIWTEKIKPAFDELGGKIKDFFLKFEWGQTLVDFITGIGDAIKGAWNLIKSAFDGEDGFIGKVKSWFAAIDWTSVVTNFINKIKENVENAWESVKQWFQEKIGGLFDGIKVPGWIAKIFGGGGKGETGETTGTEGTEGVEGEEGGIDMPENMLTLDYSDLTPIPQETLESYQQLADAITSINQAISGGGEETEEGTGGGLTTALAGMPALFDNVLAAAKNLAAYLSGDFIAAIDTLLKALCITSEDEEGNVEAGGGNTLFNAMGEIYGLFSNTLGTSKDLGAYWQGEFIEAINALKKGIGPAIGVLLTMAGVAAGTAGQFERLAAAINAVADAYNALKSGGGSGGEGEGGGVDGTRASGGAVSANSSYLVGERGPELFTPTRSGYIKPNEDLGGKETVINVTFAGDVIGDEKSISAFVKRAVKRGIREEVYAGA